MQHRMWSLAPTFGQAREEPVEIMAGELPAKGLGGLLVTLLEGDEVFAQKLKVGEVVGGEDLALNHREVDLDLVEPGSMGRKVDEAQLRPRSLKALYRSLSPVRGAVVHDPEHAIGGGVGLLSHHSLDQPAEGFDAVLGLATTEESGPMDIPGGQISQRTFALVAVLHPHGGVRSGWQGRVAAHAGLDGGLLVGTDNVLSFSERLTLPSTLVEIQHPSGFMREVGVAGEDPGAMVEGADGVLGEPPPDGGARDRCDEAPLHRLPSHLPGAPAAQGGPAGRRQLTSQRFHLHPRFGGKRPAVCQSGVDPPVRSNPPRRIVCATYIPSGVWCPASVRSPCWGSLRRPTALSWRGQPSRRGRCGRALVLVEDGTLLFGELDAIRALGGHSFSFWRVQSPPKILSCNEENASNNFSQGPLSAPSARGSAVTSKVCCWMKSATRPSPLWPK